MYVMDSFTVQDSVIKITARQGASVLRLFQSLSNVKKSNCIKYLLFAILPIKERILELTQEFLRSINNFLSKQGNHPQHTL